MALVLKDRVKETCSAPGTGTVTLLGATTGYSSFSVIGNANTTYYCIADQGGNNWEVGIGTYTASGTTLSRDTVLSNSLGTTAKIDFSSGTQDVFVTYPAEESVYVNGSTITPGSSASLPVTSGGTGQTSYTNGELLIGNSTGNTLTKATLTAGSNVTITNGAGSITIAASSGSGVTVSATAPVSPSSGNLWYNTNDGTLYTYYSSAWVDNSSFSNMLPSEISLEGGNAVGGTVELTLDNENAPFTNFPLQSIFDNGLSGTLGYQNSVDGGVSSTAYDVFGSAIDCGLAT